MHASATNRVSRGLTHAAQTPLRSSTPNYQQAGQVAQTQLMCGAMPHQWSGQVYYTPTTPHHYTPTSFQTPPRPTTPAMAGQPTLTRQTPVAQHQSQLPPGSILAGPVIYANQAALQNNPAYAAYGSMLSPSHGISPGGIQYVNGLPMPLTQYPPSQCFWNQPHHSAFHQPVMPQATTFSPVPSEGGFPAYCIPHPQQKQASDTQSQKQDRASPAPAASRSNSNSPTNSIELTRSCSNASEPAPVTVQQDRKQESYAVVAAAAAPVPIYKAAPIRLNRIHTLNGQTPVREEGRLNGQQTQEGRLDGQHARLYQIQEGGRLNRQPADETNKFNSLRTSTPGRESIAHSKAGGEESLDYVMKQNRVSQVDIIRNQLDVCGNMLIRMQHRGNGANPIPQVPVTHSGPPPGLALPNLERDGSDKSNSRSPPPSPRTQKYGNVTPQLRQFYEANKGRANRNRRRRLNQRIRREREEQERQQMFQKRMPSLQLNAPTNPTSAVPLAFRQKRTPEARAQAVMW